MPTIDKRKLEWPYQCLQHRFQTKEGHFIPTNSNILGRFHQRNYLGSVAKVFLSKKTDMFAPEPRFKCTSQAAC